MDGTTKKGSFFRQFIGTKAFYATVIAMIVPIMVQQGITSFVNLLDNVMVGRLNQEDIVSVTIVNQLIFIFNLTIFGGVSGASIFGAQYYGKDDIEGFRYTFRFKLWIAVIVSIVGIVIFIIFGEVLINHFLNESSEDTGNIEVALRLSKEYLAVSLFGVVPFAIVQCFGSTLKDMGQTVEPMIASVIAILTNLVLNYLLIFGNFGFPKLGVTGAAIATVIARYIELIYIVIATIRKRKRYTFIIGAFKSIKVPADIVKKITITGMPLLVNELLWAVGTTLTVWCYSLRGMSALNAVNINNTVWNVFTIIMIALGNAISIIVGQHLGSNDMEGAKDNAKKLLFLIVVINIGMGLLIMLASPFVPLLYNVDENTRKLASRLLLISGLFLPIESYIHGTYFTIRSGGKTLVTFLFDCVFALVISFPVAFLLSNFTTFSFEVVFLMVHGVNIIKLVIGTLIFKSGIWARNIVDEVKE